MKTKKILFGISMTMCLISSCNNAPGEKAKEEKTVEKNGTDSIRFDGHGTEPFWSFQITKSQLYFENGGTNTQHVYELKNTFDAELDEQVITFIDEERKEKEIRITRSPALSGVADRIYPYTVFYDGFVGVGDKKHLKDHAEYNYGNPENTYLKPLNEPLLFELGKYSMGEFWENESDIQNKQWMGLYSWFPTDTAHENEYHWKPCVLISQKAVDDCVDSGDEKTATLLSTDTPNLNGDFTGNILVLSGVKNLNTNPVKPIKLSKSKIYPGEHLDVGAFTFFARGTVKGEHISENILDYELWVQFEKDGVKHVNRFVDVVYFDDSFVEILMAADLDGDGLTDFLIDAAHKYGYQHYHLFLTTMAKPEQSHGKIVGLLKGPC